MELADRFEVAGIGDNFGELFELIELGQLRSGIEDGGIAHNVFSSGILRVVTKVAQ